MMLDPNKKALPFGVVTIVLVGMALGYTWLTKSACKQLEQSMNMGYVLRWSQPQLLLVTSNQQSHAVEANSKEEACEIMLKELRIQ